MDLMDWKQTSTSLTGLFAKYKGSDVYGIWSWDVSNVTNMYIMFYDIEFNPNVRGWDVSNVVEFSTCFKVLIISIEIFLAGRFLPILPKICLRMLLVSNPTLTHGQIPSKI